MKAIVVMDQDEGTAGMKLVERPEPQAAINDVVVRVHASGFVPTEMAWPSTWTDRRDRDRTPSIPGHELAGVVAALGYGTTGLSVGQRVFGLDRGGLSRSTATSTQSRRIPTRGLEQRRRLSPAAAPASPPASSRPFLLPGPSQRLPSSTTSLR